MLRTFIVYEFEEAFGWNEAVNSCISVSPIVIKEASTIVVRDLMVAGIYMGPLIE